MPDNPVKEMHSNQYDVLVVGGGINGTGIARDAALRGLKVCLVEKNDFGSGTTAYSSRLIHGGLRYLEHLEFDLVRESLRERGYLYKTMPHLVRPLPLGIPIYQKSRRGLPVIGLGMVLYDFLSMDYPWPRHRILNTKQFLKLFPGVNAQHLTGGALYYDAQVNFPERLCIENMLDAYRHGATALNHTQVTKLVFQENRVTGVEVLNLLSGEASTLHAKVIINASGPWVDEFLNLADTHHPPKMGITKGTHIIVKRFPGGPEKALYLEAAQDGRPLFILPWQDEYYLIGTTDTYYQGNLDQVIPTEEEVQYLIAEANCVLPKAKLTQGDILFTYAGLRPLPASHGKSTGEVTRKHIIYDHSLTEGVLGLVSIIGGKITTYRNLAKETIDYVGRLLNQKLPPCRTHIRPLPGGEDIGELAAYKEKIVSLAVERYGVSAKTVFHLIDLYGSCFQEVLALTVENGEWKKTLSDTSPNIQAQVIYGVRKELAKNTEDILMRRTGEGLREGVGLGTVRDVARLVGQEMGWTEAQIEADVDAYEKKVHILNQPLQYPVKIPPQSKSLNTAATLLSESSITN